MKKVFALLLVAVMAVTCLCAALSVSAEDAKYADKVSLLPTSEKDVKQASGKTEVSMSNGELKIVRAEGSDPIWPSVEFAVNKEIDLSATPKLHLVFTLDPDGTDPDVDDGRGVNGMIYYTVDGGEEQSKQLSALGGRNADDYRISSDVYVDFGETGKITVTRVTLSIYSGEAGQAVTWKTLAFAGEDDGSSAGTSSEESSTSTETSSTSSESSKVPTGDTGIVVFALLGLVACAGVAVAVKVRH